MLDINSYNFGELKEYQVTPNIAVVINFFLFLFWSGEEGGNVLKSYSLVLSAAVMTCLKSAES